MQIQLLLVAILFSIVKVHGTTYYVSNSGSDNSPGITSNLPWKSLTKVNSFQFSPGDSILFEGGGIWRGQLQLQSGSGAGRLVYGKYGIGSNPRLLGSVDVSPETEWIDGGNQVWISAQSSSIDVGNLLFNQEESCGRKKWNLADCTQQGDFWYDKNGSHKVYLFSSANPGNFYNHIEAALTNFIVYAVADSHIVVRDFTIQYGSADGVEIRNSHHFTLSNCDVSFIGGGELTNQVRYGGGIQFWANSHDNVVEQCSFFEIYDDAVTNQGNASAGGTIQQYNIIYRNNLIWNCSESSFCYFIQPAVTQGSFMKNIYFENNTCYNAGGGWGGLQRLDLKGFQVYMSTQTAPMDSIFIRNNIFSESRCFLFFDHNSIPGLNFTKLDYNCWHTTEPSDTMLAIYNNSQLTVLTDGQFTVYQSTYGKDEHSLHEDPILLDPIHSDFHILNNSPCVDSGLEGISAIDFDGFPRPFGNGFDMGAYEYWYEGIETPTNSSYLVFFPNPCQTYLKLKGTFPGIWKYKIVGMNGEKLTSGVLSNTLEISIDNLPNGLFWLEVSNSKQFKQGKFIVYH